MQKVFLIHGWSVKDTTTYQSLHIKLAEHGFDLHNIYLGRYVSLDDNIQIRDISKALHNALKLELGNIWNDKFHIVTHSAGSLIVKHWIVHHYKNNFSKNKSLQNLVFLAAPHFGSRLAHHGRSMLTHMKYAGDTGTEILKSLELGSEFSWNSTNEWFNKSNWQAKGIRPFNLIGDKIEKDFFAEKIFHAGFEKGSDMVVRVAAANMNCKRFEVRTNRKKFKQLNAITGIPFGVLADYVHSGEKCGIMNSIKKSSTLNDLNLKLIVDCLKVSTANDYKKIRKSLTEVTARTREKKQAFAQLDFRFTDQDGKPINDYVIKLGVIKNGKDIPSRSVVHAHRNLIEPNHFTMFINVKFLKPKLEYFIELFATSSTTLYQYDPSLFRINIPPHKITELICEDQTTQIDMVLKREPDKKLFVFHKGDDKELPIKWNRKGRTTKDTGKY